MIWPQTLHQPQVLLSTNQSYTDAVSQLIAQESIIWEKYKNNSKAVLQNHR